MSADLVSLQNDLKEYQEQLDIVVAQLRDDSDNAELAELQNELKAAIALTNDAINELKPSASLQAPQYGHEKAVSPPSEPQKWSRENHPAFNNSSNRTGTAPAAAEDKDVETISVAYKVNDEVQARWVSGDKAFYPARITSITGSSTSPIYIVTFKGYGNTETVRSKEIRPLQKPQKRKPDVTTTDATLASVSSSSTHTAAHHAPPPPPPVGAPYSAIDSTSSAFVPPPPPPLIASAGTSSNNGVVLSAAANLYPEKVLEAKRAAERQGDGAGHKRKKIKTKEVEAGKNKWMEFSAKSKFSKSQKKDSMFRTPDGIHGRVGFTGSGQAMRKDPNRSRHVYQQNEELE